MDGKNGSEGSLCAYGMDTCFDIIVLEMGTIDSSPPETPKLRGAEVCCAEYDAQGRLQDQCVM